MNLKELKEKIYMENVRMFKEYFLEDDEDINYVVTNEDEFKIVDREELVSLIHNDLKLEHVDEDFCLGILNNESIKIEYM